MNIHTKRTSFSLVTSTFSILLALSHNPNGPYVANAQTGNLRHTTPLASINSHRRLDRPETVIDKSAPAPDLNTEDEPLQTITTTTITTSPPSEEPSSTDPESYPERDESNTITLPDPPPKSPTTQKSKCLTVSSCTQCSVMAQELQKDVEEAWTCAWQLAQEETGTGTGTGNGEVVDREKGTTDGEETYAVEDTSRHNVTNPDVNQGYCVSIYKTIAEGVSMAGADMVCDAGVRSDTLTVAAAVTASREEEYEEFEIEKTGGGMQSFAFLIGLGVLAGAFHLKNKLPVMRHGKSVGNVMQMMGMASDGGKDINSGKNKSSNGFSQEQTVPLSSAREDEWGWEEDGFQNTSSSSSSISMRDKQREDEEDVQMALALSLSAHSNADAIPTIPTSTPIPPSSSSSSSSKIRPPKSSSHHGSHHISIPYSTQSSSKKKIRPPAKFRKNDYSGSGSSSSVRSTSSRSRNTPKKPPSSDIFQSMGLTAKPTFVPPTNNSASNGNGSSTPSSSSSSAKLTTSSMGSTVLIKNNSSKTPSTPMTDATPTTSNTSTTILPQESTSTNDSSATPKYSSKFVSNVPSSSYPKSNALNNEDDSSVGTNPNWEDDDDLDDLLGD